MNAHPSPGGPPAERGAVVLLHASGSSARQWDSLAQTLRETHDVHAIDLHGHGHRAPWAGTRPQSLRDDAGLALDVLERAGGGHVVGHSYGGAVAMQVAAARPGLVRSLAVYEPVLLNLLAEQAPANPGTREVFAVASEIRRRHAEGDDFGAAGLFVGYWAGPGSWQGKGPGQQAAIASRIGTILAHFDALAAEPLPPPAPTWPGTPLLVLHGTRTTPAARKVAMLLRERLPRAEHVAMHGLGHLGPVTDTARVDARLLRFLRSSMTRATTAGEVSPATRRSAPIPTREAASGRARTPRLPGDTGRQSSPTRP